ncbi:MAG: HAMP domain-containing protein, partial [Candidatus Hydrothermarchaeaceae archaeon]
MGFNDWKIGKRLLSSFMVVAALVVIAGSVGIYTLDLAGKAIDVIAEEEAPLVDAANEMKISMAMARNNVEEFKGATSVIATDDESVIAGIEADYRATVVDFDGFGDAIVKGGEYDGVVVIATDNDEIVKLVEEADRIHNEEFQAATEDLIEAGKSLVAQKKVRDRSMENMETQYDEISADLANTEDTVMASNDLSMADKMYLADKIMEAKFSLANTRIVIEEYVQQVDATNFDELDDRYKDYIDEFDGYIVAGKNLASSAGAGNIVAAIEELDGDHEEFQDESTVLRSEQRTLIALKLEQDRAMVIVDSAGDEISLLLTQTEELASGEMQNAMVDAEAMQSTSNIILVIAILLGIALAVAIGLFTTKSITEPINRIVNEMKKLAQTGDLSIRASADRKDEIGEMASSLNMMLDNVAGPIKELSDASAVIADGDLTKAIKIENAKGDVSVLIDSFTAMVDNLRNLIKNIKENADFTASA